MVDVRYFDSVGSTNEEARRFPAGTVIVAKRQTAGRGRLGRSWSSGEGGIYMSIVLSSEAGDAKYLTITAALAARNVLLKLYNVKAGIKWPNDLVISGKKLCGILSEGALSGRDAKMIVGIGINTNNALPPEIQDVAVTLRGLGIEADNERVVAALIEEFGALRSKGRNEILDAWRAASDTLGKEVTVVTKRGEIHGLAKDIDGECNLIVKTDDGEVKISEGDVFVR